MMLVTVTTAESAAGVARSELITLFVDAGRAIASCVVATAILVASAQTDVALKATMPWHATTAACEIATEISAEPPTCLPPLTVAVRDILVGNRRARLESAARAVSAAFGTDVQLAVDVFSDPEALVREKRITLSVISTATQMSVREAMDRFDETYWLDASDVDGGWLTVRAELA